MLQLRENRDKLIQRVINEVTADAEFEFEPSDIIEALFESKEFNDTKAKKFKAKKLEESKETQGIQAFFPDATSYIKRKKESHD